MKRTVYQTVKCTTDKECILREAPFYCKDKEGELKEWLGEGYYFWETFKSLAKWWGIVHYRKKGFHYIVCETSFSCDEEDLLDLAGNTEQMSDVLKIIDMMRRSPAYQSKTFTAQFVINFIRTKTPFKYKAIRAWGIDCAYAEEIRSNRFFFSSKSFMNLMPEVQICVIDKSTLQLPMNIVYDSEADDLESLTV